jgi:hypothetical protein
VADQNHCYHVLSWVPAGCEIETEVYLKKGMISVFKQYQAVLFTLILGLVGLFQSFYPTILSGFTRLQSDLGDTRFNHYLLEHSFQWIAGSSLHSSLWDPPFFFPASNVLAYSDILLGVAPTYWALRLINFSPIPAFQIWMIIQQVLTYTLAIVFLRRLLSCSWAASALGAYLITFGNPRLAQIGRHQLLPLYFLLGAPISLVEVWRSDSKTHRWFWTVVGGACLVLQMITAFYYVWFAGLVTLVLIVVAFLLPSTRQELLTFMKRGWAEILLILAICALTVMPVVARYLSVVSEVGMRDFSEVVVGVPQLSHLFFTGTKNYLWGWLDAFGSGQLTQEKQLGIGFVSLGAVCLGLLVIPVKRFQVLVCLSLFLLVLITFELPNGFIALEYLHRFLPGTGAIRAPGRIIFIFLILYGIALACLTDYLLKEKISYSLCCILVCLIVAEQSRSLSSYGFRQNNKTIASLVKAIEKGESCNSFLLVQEGTHFPSLKYQLDAMWAGLKAGLPTVNGYSGNSPANWNLASNIFTTHDEYNQLIHAANMWRMKTQEKEICLLRRDRYGKAALVGFNESSKSVVARN